MNELTDVIFLQRYMNNQYTEGTTAQFKDLPDDLQLTNLLKARGANKQPIAIKLSDWEAMPLKERETLLKKAAAEA